MAKLAFSELSNQIDMLSYAERIRLLDKIVRTLHAPMKVPAKKTADFAAAFGLWKDREVSLEAIREKAWGRS